MNAFARSLKTLAASLAAVAIAACAHFGGPPLEPGVSTVADLQRSLGSPAMRWREADGGEQLAYPQGPMGVHTWMARTDAGGRLVSLDNVLQPRYFARTQAALQIGEGAHAGLEARAAELGAGAQGEGGEAGEEGFEAVSEGVHGELRWRLPAPAGVVTSKK